MCAPTDNVLPPVAVDDIRIGRKKKNTFSVFSGAWAEEEEEEVIISHLYRLAKRERESLYVRCIIRIR